MITFTDVEALARVKKQGEADVSLEERKTAVRLERMLRDAGAEHAKVRAVATKPGQVSNVRIEVPFDQMGLLKLLLGKLGREA